MVVHWQIHSFLGGRVEMVCGNAKLTLWIEPRISLATMALTGWRCSSSLLELTPDFLITCGDVGNREGYVIDATLSKGDEIFEKKS